jgi:hypothetical protein
LGEAVPFYGAMRDRAADSDQPARLGRSAAPRYDPDEPDRAPAQQ